jgi:hypothetical protein
MSDVKNGSVGKLKLSNEMKEKLEAVTGSRKNSIRSNASSSKRSELEIAPETIEVRKLSENRKLLMEQKLGGGTFSFIFSLYNHFFTCFQHNVSNQKGTAHTISNLKVFVRKYILLYFSRSYEIFFSN